MLFRSFGVYNWDNYLKNYVEIWGGDDLTQTEAGKYSVTFILRKDGDKPYRWAGNVFDRSSVTVEFEIRYKMLTLPELPEAVTYSGSRLNILNFVENISYSDLMAEYNNYVDITGSMETDIGTYVLYLEIKDEYGTAIRWNDGTVNGLIGTYQYVWKIDPIKLVKPVKNDAARIEYNGKEHTVFEALVGYSADGSTEALMYLMDNVKVSAEGFRSIDAGTFTATFSLPNANYVWVDENGTVDSVTTSIPITWTISPCVLDLSGVDWNYNKYYEENGHGFEYTLDNGKV